MAAKVLPPQIANRRTTMFRNHWSTVFLGPDRPGWVDQLLNPESLRASGYFDPEAVPRVRARLAELPRFSPRGFVYDAGLTSVVTTQLWHHIYCGGGLCDLPTWTPPVPRGARVPEAVASPM
jgi:asparagine synthase (glutamine-hydrolysing)